jgi:hypothetical protein
VDRGIAAHSQADQLTRWITKGYIDTECERTLASFEALYQALAGFFKKIAA